MADMKYPPKGIIADDYLNDLNEAQRLAVTYCDGPSLVIAGAGSGKTRVLTYKIVHLINLGIAPYRILALTFTNKAAREMKERIALLVGNAVASQLWMGTFHSIFAKILRINSRKIGFEHDFTIYDTTDSKSLVKHIVKEMNLDEKIYKPSMLQSRISYVKNLLFSPTDYASTLERKTTRCKYHASMISITGIATVAARLVPWTLTICSTTPMCYFATMTMC